MNPMKCHSGRREKSGLQIVEIQNNGIMEKIRKVTVIGAGNMGGAIAIGMAAGGTVLPSDIVVTAGHQLSIDRVRAVYQEITGFTDNSMAVRGADLVILAVKPRQLPDVVSEIREAVDYGSTVIASVVAGVVFEDLYGMFGRMPDTPMYRIIPNTAISRLKSTTFIASDRDVPVISEQIDTIFRSMGDVIWTDERMLSCGMSLASCGIAYAFRYLDAAIRGGMALGFSEVESSRAVLSTMEGALAILKQGGTTPRQEILKVATPGGYTARGLQTMDDKGFDDAVHSALRSSAG